MWIYNAFFIRNNIASSALWCHSKSSPLHRVKLAAGLYETRNFPNGLITLKTCKRMCNKMIFTVDLNLLLAPRQRIKNVSVAHGLFVKLSSLFRNTNERQSTLHETLSRWKFQVNKYRVFVSSCVASSIWFIQARSRCCNIELKLLL